MLLQHKTNQTLLISGKPAEPSEHDLVFFVNGSPQNTTFSDTDLMFKFCLRNNTILLLISYHKAFLISLNVSAQNPTSSLVGNDESSQQQASGYTFTRNLTTKGSRYAPKTPLKHIHASDGARLILDKFNNNNSPAPVCTSKQYYGE